MSVITLSGPLGAGAPEVGQSAAQRLGLDYVDREVLTAAAQSLRVSPEDLAAKEQWARGLGARLARLLEGFVERSAKTGTWDPTAGEAGLEYVLSRTYAEAAALPAVDDQTYLSAIRTIVLDLAARGGLVLIGRGGQVLLRDVPRGLHVLVLCPRGVRIERVAEREGLAMDAALRRVEESDRSRTAFHRKYFRVDVDDPALYDIVVDTSRFSYEAAAEIVAAAAGLRFPAGG